MTAMLLLSALAAVKATIPGRHLVVTAHPDDETVSFGGALSRIADVRILQLTTGAHAPEMTGTRRAERTAAFTAARWDWPVQDAGAPDGSAFQHIDVLQAHIARALDDVDVVWTHPYEGGHLDHDTAAWLVQAACRGRSVLRMEFASYHCNATKQTFGDFWPDHSVRSVVVTLTGDALERKKAAIAAYVSQAAILRKFPAIEREAYRVAPVYDFTKPATPPRCRWDIKGYRPSTSEWRRTVALQGAA